MLGGQERGACLSQEKPWQAQGGWGNRGRGTECKSSLSSLPVSWEGQHFTWRLHTGSWRLWTSWWALAVTTVSKTRYCDRRSRVLGSRGVGADSSSGPASASNLLEGQEPKDQSVSDVHPAGVSWAHSLGQLCAAGEGHRDARDSFLLKERSATVLVKSYDLIWGVRMANRIGWQCCRGGYERTVIPLGASVVGGVGRVRGMVATLLWPFAFFMVW